ncbi:uncharacterized protein PV07_07230 [Cladophialophora immunda]|uniref:Uncharacterized protein n=1 Tax=Cladophialophora immunda TaxID=569365 RepID=A0A0D1ZHS1_9EURO|nr:uncharacterized protein PV07_07230 [Cladophialophora immunda]KIW27496.1 hypothetical protein PV07_07230 [Cladophialophora immunda]OQV04165.1 hypothetical protein CLAIMM_09088 [Cladophialophora immunda]
MANASDVITYIGVPLAVLGVLPILYTFMLAILTQRRIRAALVHHGHRPVSTTRPHDGFTIRSSPMTSLIEVELPRYTIAPLERGNEEYWKTTAEGREAPEEHHHLLTLDRAESTLSMIEEGRVRGFLRGGSWRGFHWKKLIVGKRLYRIQYEDELREPPAEVSFEDLVVFLLDWGAVPEGMGWEKLRSGGLWTPSGTVLLKKPEDDGADGDEGTKKRGRGVDWVLRTSMPDESDGILSLTIRWTRDEATSVRDMRGAESLPPGWGRLTQPALLEANEKRKENEKDLPTRIEGLKSANKHSMDSSSFRFHTEDNRIQKLLWEHNNIETGFVCAPFRRYEQSSAALWFTCAASALLAHKSSTSGGLWAFETPAEIKTFVRKDTIPCGVMVLLGLLSENDAPQWSYQKDDHNDGMTLARQHQQWLQARLAAERLEATMPPEQARIHKMNRESNERQQRHNDMMTSLAARQEREERKVVDAIASPRMDIKRVSEACLTWLIERGEVGKEWTVNDLAEAVCYLMVVDLQDPSPPQKEEGKVEDEQSEAMRIIGILDEWMAWATAGGMKKQQFRLLEKEKDKVAFCHAVALVAVVAEAMSSNNAVMGKVGSDMLECMRLWRKVRLG